jgi:hypothetical protein
MITRKKKIKEEVIDIDTGIKFKSTHELWFYWYCLELKEQGYADKIRFKEKQYVLSDHVIIKILDSKFKKKSKTLLKPKIYSDDFGIAWNLKAKDIFYQTLESFPRSINLPFIANLELVSHSQPVSLIDVKNPFNKDNVKRMFKEHQKWVYEKYNLYIQDIDIIDLMAYTFTPRRFLLTDSKKSYRKINHVNRTLENYVDIRTKMIKEYESRNV